MAYPSRPPMMQGVSVSTMVGPQFTLTTNLVPSVRIPMNVSQQSLSSIPTPMNRGPPMRPHNPPLPAPPRPPVLSRPPSYSQRAESSGPNVTVFVGNITERAPDVMIRHILNACGPVLNWKRVQGASGKLQGFGFCDYGNPDAALRAIRLLHSYEIATNKLVVKGDSKSNEVLNEYKEKRKKEHQNGGDSPLQDERKIEEDEDDYIDDEMRAEDQRCLDRITAILSDHKKDIVNYIPPHSRQDQRDKRMSKVQEKLVALSTGSDLANIPSTLNLDDMEDVEEGKKELISREITQFREQMKKQEEEKERERKLRDKDRSDRDRDRDRNRDRERERERDRERERREREERRRKSRSVSRSSSMPRRSGSISHRSRSPSEEVRHSRKDKRHNSRSRSPATRKTEKEILREKEKDAEEKERKEQERKVRKKEMQYQERLKNWESREHKKQKELDRESDKEKSRENEKEKDARRLKEFLEDYDDERDDPRYYKGSAFQRKLVDRDHEKELDAKDRVKEKEELEELRTKIHQEGHENPDEAYELACAAREELYKPKLLLKPSEKVVVVEPSSPIPAPPSVIEEAVAPPPQEIPPSDSSDDDDPHSDAPPEPPMDHDESSLSRDIFSSAETTPQAPKRKRMDVKDVFNQEDDDTPSKKKKLPLPGKDKMKEKGGEEKRKHIKSLIDKIPTSKEELFAFPIDSSLVDTILMEKRIRPWINKKIIEYIGEPEPTLVDFICSKVLVGSEPQSLLNDVQMVLDDEAEVFVVKMWRLLIYEIGAKKMGLGKS